MVIYYLHAIRYWLESIANVFICFLILNMYFNKCIIIIIIVI
jgi:hypothetical protein